MSNIQKYQSNQIVVVDGKTIIPSEIPISKKEKDIYLANKNFPKVSEIQDMNIVVNEIHSYVNMTIMDRGVNVPPEEIDYLKKRVTEDILRDFTRYTLEEIKLSFHYGVRGELGEFFGLNASTFYNWLKKFRYELLPPINQRVAKYLPNPEEKPALSQQEADRLTAINLLNAFKKLKEEKVYDFYDFGNLGYKLLERLDMLKLSNEEKFALIDKSKAKFKATLSDRNNELLLKGKNFLKIDLKRAYVQIERGNNPTFEHQIKIGAMRLAIYEYIKDCVDRNFDFEEELNERLKNYQYES